MAETVGFEETPSQSDEDRLAEIRALLQYGMTFRQENREKLWRQSEDQYEGRHWGMTHVDDHTADLITVNLSFSTVNTIVPYVTSSDPRFLVSPYSHDATLANARLQQAWLNRLWRKQDTGAYEATVSVAEDYLIYGDGYFKVSYGLVQKLKDPSAQAASTLAELYVDRIDPWDLFIDPMADGIHNARWLAHRIYTTKRELKKDQKYDGVDIDELTGSSADIIDEHRSDRTIALGDTTQDWVVLYEFYDIVAEEMWTFTDAGPRPLRRVSGVEMAPIVQVGNYRLPRSPYHMGELEQLWPMQQELNKSRSQLITHRRRNAAKYLMREDAITEKGIAALASPIVNEIVPVKGEIPLDNLVKPAQMQSIPSEAYSSGDQAERDIYEISGVNEYLRGASSEIRRTATEASIIEGASNVKTTAKLADIERAVRRVGALIIDTAKVVYPLTDVDEMAMYLTGGEAEQIARDEAGPIADELSLGGDRAGAQQAMIEASMSDVVITPTEDIFAGEYEVDVETGSTEMRSPQFKEQKFREMFTTLVSMQQELQMAGVSINLRKVAEMWFEAAQITDVEGMFSDMQGPDPMGNPMDPAMMGAAGMPPGGPPGLPPEMLGGMQPNEGQPNTAAAEPPLDPLTAMNTGALAPVA